MSSIAELACAVPPPFAPRRLSPDEAARVLTNYDIGPRDGDGRLVVAAMSGGVDSAVTALLLRERGYRVIGMNMRLYRPPTGEAYPNPCCSPEAMEDARASSQRLDLPFYPVNFEQEFERHVIDYFLEEYAAGRTPNPCLECNRYVKFHHLITKARAVGADFLATGHYARIERDASGRYHLHQAADPDKDQAYVLYPLNQEQLSYLLFPLGRLQKREVREIAVAFGLPVAEKPDSMETCFVGKGAYADFVLRRRPGLDQPGDIADRHGRVLGRHNGLIHYTVGQRKGIGVAAKEPLYVLELDTRTNRLVVGTRRELGFSSLLAERTAWVGGAAPTGAIDCEVQLRYRGTRYPALVEPLDEGRFRVNFAEPPQAVAPGQSAVLYQDDEVLGGGVIAESRTLLPLAGAAA